MEPTSTTKNRKKTTDIRRLTTEEFNELANNRDLRRLTDEEYERLAEKYPKMKKYVDVKDVEPKP